MRARSPGGRPGWSPATPTHRRARSRLARVPGSAGRQRRQHDHRGKTWPWRYAGASPPAFALPSRTSAAGSSAICFPYSDWGSKNRLSHKVELLSGGQRQSLALVMATITAPKIILLDEHCAALDPKTAGCRDAGDRRGGRAGRP